MTFFNDIDLLASNAHPLSQVSSLMEESEKQSVIKIDSDAPVLNKQ
jgi:hypothetical protein